MKRYAFAPVALLIAAAAPAAAMNSEEHPFVASIGATTLGLTIENSYRVNDKFGLRLPAGTGDFNVSEESGGNDLDGVAETFGIGLLGDYYPTGKNFRVSGGAIWSDHRAELSTGTLTQGNVQGRIDSVVTQREHWVPTLAIGYDHGIGENLVLSVSAGAMFGKGFDVESTETIRVFAEDGTSTEISSGKSPRVQEQVADLEDTFDKLKVLPYAQVSIGFRF